MHAAEPNRGTHRKAWMPLLLIAATLAVGIMIGTLVPNDVGADEQVAATDATPLTLPAIEPSENQFTPIVRAVRPAVVNIKVEVAAEQETAESDAEPEPGMEDFFRRFFGGQVPEGMDPRQPRRRPGEGSGFVVDAKGYIMTNRHVVADADRVQVRFADEEEFIEATVIGVDEETDLAVVKVDPGSRQLPVARLGNSDGVSVGDWAIAIGSPFGYRESVTVGIISAESREVDGASRAFQKFFQTDAAINPGNSGGPLVNTRGEVIGINTAIVSRTGAYQGLGFALPSNIAVGVYNQIIKLGRVARGSIGISFRDDASQGPLLRRYGAENGGVFVNQVTPDWPADNAGIRVEDIIVEVDGTPVADGDALVQVVSTKPVGSTVPVKLLRDGETMMVSVEIADREELLRVANGTRQRQREEAEPEAAEAATGPTFEDLTDEKREELKFDEEDGILVAKVAVASFASDLGLGEGDIVVTVNRRPVSTAKALTEFWRKLKPGEDVALKVMRSSRNDKWVAVYLAGVVPASAK
ncbi:MAG: Do family serine endopeptidase [Acidobacteria bacterium]|nr:Do family serine endopeptidase [Acidobacteriota bacterium]